VLRLLQRYVSPRSVNEDRFRLGSKQTHHAVHYPRIRGLAVQAGDCMAEGYENGDQGHPVGPCGLRSTYTFRLNRMHQTQTIATVVPVSQHVCLSRGFTRLWRA